LETGYARQIINNTKMDLFMIHLVFDNTNIIINYETTLSSNTIIVSVPFVSTPHQLVSKRTVEIPPGEHYCFEF
jgi:hypothetical protein